MKYYRNLNGGYYYLEDSGRQIYDDKIVELVKEAAETIGSSTDDVGVSSSTTPDMKTLIDVMLQRLLVHNQAKDDQIMTHIDALAHVCEQIILRMKTKFRDEVKEYIQDSEGRLVTQI